MEATVQRLFEAIRTHRRSPKLKVFVIGEDHFLRIVNGRYMRSEYSEEFGYAEVNSLDRGKILAAFAKLEFLVNECIHLHILGPESSKAGELAFLVGKLPFRQRIEALAEFGIVGASLEKKLKKLAGSRNLLAHEWDEKVAEFDGELLSKPEVLKRFGGHLKSAFEKLVEKYRELQVQVNYEQYLLDIIARLEAPDAEQTP